jgi:hypothetical protein
MIEWSQMSRIQPGTLVDGLYRRDTCPDEYFISAKLESSGNVAEDLHPSVASE